MKKYLRQPIASALFTLTLILSSCGGNDNFPNDVFLSIDDLPKYWVQGERDWIDSEIADVRTVRFYNRKFSNIPTISIGQIIGYFPTALDAEENYTDWAKDYLPRNWEAPKNIKYSPRDSQDNFEIRCLAQKFEFGETQICILVHQHNSIIMVLSVLIHDETLSWEDFLNAVDQVDFRLQGH